MFCREPVAGRAKTRLIRRLGAAGAAALAGAFILDALAKCRKLAPGRVVIAGSAPGGARRSRYFVRIARRFGARLVDQGAGGLGARMARVLKPFCREGALLIGTDTPSLPPRLLARGAALLRRAPVMIAPSLDGGYYAVGVRGTMPDIFRGVAWGRARVLDETMARLRRRRVPFALGPAWYDVDRWSDVELLAAHLERMRPRQGRVSAERRAGRPAAAIPCPATAKILRRLGLPRAGR